MNGDSNKIDFDILVDVTFFRVPLAKQNVFLQHICLYKITNGEKLFIDFL